MNTPNPNPSPELRNRMFLEILLAMGGRSDASEGPYCWTNAFCETHEGHEPDTFNRAIDAGYVTFSHDSDTECSTISITPSGRAALSQALPAPGEVERIRRAIWTYFHTLDEAAQSLPVVTFLSNRDVFLAEAIGLATVAAANVEGVAEALDRRVRIAAWNAAKKSGASDALGYAVVDAVVAEFAAIRLLSQGGGK